MLPQLQIRLSALPLLSLFFCPQLSHNLTLYSANPSAFRDNSVNICAKLVLTAAIATSEPHLGRKLTRRTIMINHISLTYGWPCLASGLVV